MVFLKSLTAVATAVLSLSSLATAAPKSKKPYFYNGFDLASSTRTPLVEMSLDR
jgi:hypothetical protein